VNFSVIPTGEAIFLDANSFISHFAPHPVFGPACHQLLKRVEQQDLLGYTSTHILSEVAHRLMTFEASTRFGWAAGKSPCGCARTLPPLGNSPSFGRHWKTLSRWGFRSSPFRALCCRAPRR
jgi:hypothetical protein